MFLMTGNSPGRGTGQTVSTAETWSHREHDVFFENNAMRDNKGLRLDPRGEGLSQSRSTSSFPQASADY